MFIHLALRLCLFQKKHVGRHVHDGIANLIAIGWDPSCGLKAGLRFDAVYGQSFGHIFGGRHQTLALALGKAMQIARRADRSATGHRP